MGRWSATNSAMLRNGTSPFVVRTRCVGASSPFKKRRIRVTNPACGSPLPASRQSTVLIAERGCRFGSIRSSAAGLCWRSNVPTLRLLKARTSFRRTFGGLFSSSNVGSSSIGRAEAALVPAPGHLEQNCPRRSASAERTPTWCWRPVCRNRSYD